MPATRLRTPSPSSASKTRPVSRRGRIRPGSTGSRPMPAAMSRAGAPPAFGPREDARVALERAPRQEAELAELRAELRAGLSGIPAGQARVLVLKDALGFSFRGDLGSPGCRSARRSATRTGVVRGCGAPRGGSGGVILPATPFGGRDERVAHPASRAGSCSTTRAPARPGPPRSSRRLAARRRLVVCRTLPGAPGDAGRADRRGDGAGRGGRRARRGGKRRKIAFFAGIDDCRFKRVVEPGEDADARPVRSTRPVANGRGKATATVEGARGPRPH